MIEGRANHEGILEAVGHWWRDYRKRRQDLAALAAFSGEDLARMAHDLGVSAEDLHDLAARGDNAAEEAPRMMTALGLDKAHDIDAHLMRDIEIACARCGSKERCRSDLDAGEAAAHFEEYCINAETFTALRAIREAASSARG
ncbi:MAG: DUF6455 family protein [Proteobacteria bacterium]|nr:DUF6455 family protein [Pseudomonadota bacterium]